MRPRVGSFLSAGAVLTLLTFSSLTAVFAQSWRPTDTMSTPRRNHTATLLSNGKVLAAGECVIGTIAELYDPGTGTWARTGSLNAPRCYHAATLLRDGRVLVTGGVTWVPGTANSAFAEIYDPATGQWTMTGSLNTPRRSHTATLLANGQVLIAGGVVQDHPAVVLTGTAELYDPATGVFTPTGALAGTTSVHTATLLPDGRVLVAGGRGFGPFESGSLTSAQVYDPTAGTWSLVGRMVEGRETHAAILLGNKVLVAGGDTASAGPRASVELFDPALSTFALTGATNERRGWATLALLPNGQVLTAGGFPGEHLVSATAEIYDPPSGTWTWTASMGSPRGAHTLTALPNGQIMATGGGTGSATTASAELYGPLNRAPVAGAGADQVVDEGSAVALDGTGSGDPDGTAITFSWRQLAGPAVELAGADTATPSFTAPLLPLGIGGSQTLTFELTVSDGDLTSTDTVDVIVVNVNHAPVADAGGDQVVNEGSPVTLDGAHSYDPDQDAITYQWDQISGPPVTLNGWDTPTPSFVAPLLPGGVGGTTVLAFQLAVTDGELSSVDTVNVVVEQVNHQPVADAGAPQTKRPDVTVTLNGSRSYDPDGDSIGFQWTQVDGPGVTLANATTAAPSFTTPPVTSPTTLTFRLVVSDGALTSHPSDVVVTVTNNTPVCTAARAVPELIWPPNHRMVPVAIAGVTDPDNDAMVLTITGVTQDEPVNGLGDGDTSPDAVIQNAGALIRAERSGQSNGRVYQLQFTADDGLGGACTGAVNVRVPHNMKPGATVIDDGQLSDSTLP